MAPILRKSALVAGRIAAVLVLALVFLASALFALLWHLNLPAGRRFTASTLNGLLSKTFYGKLEIGAFDHLDPHALVARDVSVRDEYGNLVLKVSELRVRVDLTELLYALFFAKGKVTLVIEHVRVEHADAWILADPKTNAPTLARALTPRPTAARPKGTATATRTIRVWLPAIEIGDAAARGKAVAGAPTLEAHVARVQGSLLASPRGAAVDVARASVVVRGFAGADTTGVLTLHVREPGAVWGAFDGYVGDVQVDTVGRVDGGRLALTLDVPRARASDLRALWPEWPIVDDAAGHVEVTGRLPELSGQVQVEIGGRSRIAAVGNVVAGPHAAADLRVRADDVDLHGISASAPPSNIDADASLSVKLTDGKLTGHIDAKSAASTLGKEQLPAAEVSGTLDANGFHGTARLEEPGMPVTGEFNAARDGSVEFSARAKRFTIQNAPRARRALPATGSADLEVRGKVEGGRISAQVSGSVADFATQGVHAASGRVNGRIGGKLSSPDSMTIDAHVEGTDVSGDRFRFNDAKVSVSGPITHPRLTAKLTDNYGPNVTASGSLSTRGGARIENLDVEVERHGAKVQGRIGRVHVANGRVDIDHLKINGSSGELDADVHVDGDDVRLVAKGQNVDLDTLAAILGLPRGTIGGRLEIDAALESDAHGQQGHLHLALGNAAFSILEGVALRVDATLDERQFEGNASMLVRDLGAAGTKWQTELTGPVTRVASWRDMLGAAKAEIGNLDIGRVELAIPASARIDRIDGRGFVELDLERKQPAPLPNALIVAVTRGLEVVRSGAAPGDKPLELKGIDLQVGANFDGDSGQLNGMTQLVDAQGPLASASGTVRVDERRILAHPKEAGAVLADAPLDLAFALDDRPIEALPQAIRPAGLTGHVGGRIVLGGSYSTPTFTASGYARGLAATSTHYALPVDVVANARYVKATGELGVSADVAQAHRSVARLDVKGVAAWNDLLHGTPQDRPTWTGTGDVVLDRLPLEVFAPFAAANASGHLDGRIRLVHETALPEIDAKLELAEMRIDRIRLGNGKLDIESSANHVQARLGFRDADGTLDATTTAAVRWSGAVPELNPAEPVSIGLKAKRFDSVVLLPVLKDVLSDLSGDIDANLTAELRPEPDPDVPGSTRWTGLIHGDAQMPKGQLALAHLGMQFSDVTFHASARATDHETEVFVDKFSARARSDVPNVSGTAHLYLEHLELTHATAQIALTKPVPILIEGVSQAQATGRAQVSIERRAVPEGGGLGSMECRLPSDAKEYMDVTANIPVLEARLPRSSSRKVVGLDDNPDIVLSEPISEPKELSHGGEVVPWCVSFNLGNQVKIVGDGLNLPVRGDPILTLAREVGVGGQIELIQGGHAQIAVQGLVSKAFVIESGVIRFDTDDPSNPHVDITASWHAPDGTTVFVNVRGTYREAQLTLRSDPPIADQNRIQALLLGGSSSEGQTAGIGIGAGVLGALLSDTALGNVEFRTANEQTAGNSNYSTYSAAIRVSDQVWFEGSYKRADTPTVEQNAFSGTIDWRFHRNWSVRTEVGQLGTKMDLLWRYRY